MYARFQLDLDTERDSETRSRDGVTDRCGDLKTLGFGCPSRHIDWSPELPGQNVSSRDAVLEVIFEEKKFPIEGGNIWITPGM